MSVPLVDCAKVCVQIILSFLELDEVGRFASSFRRAHDLTRSLQTGAFILFPARYRRQIWHASEADLLWLFRNLNTSGPGWLAYSSMLNDATFRRCVAEFRSTKILTALVTKLSKVCRNDITLFLDAVVSQTVVLLSRHDSASAVIRHIYTLDAPTVRAGHLILALQSQADYSVCATIAHFLPRPSEKFHCRLTPATVHAVYAKCDPRILSLFLSRFKEGDDTCPRLVSYDLTLNFLWRGLDDERTEAMITTMESFIGNRAYWNLSVLEVESAYYNIHLRGSIGVGRLVKSLIVWLRDIQRVSREYMWELLSNFRPAGNAFFFRELHDAKILPSDMWLDPEEP